MGRKAKISPEIKIEIVEGYLNGKFSISSASIRANVSTSTVEE